MRDIELRRISKRFRNRSVLNALNLRLPGGEITSLLGRSGSGKSTLGRIIAGLVSSDSGEIIGREEQRMMLQPQDFVIWPHLTVRKNVELGVSSRRNGREVGRFLEMFHIDSCASHLAGELSFGQQHRVALARSFAFGPNLLILDEPLAHLDGSLRRTVAREIAQVCRTERVTALWITHDPSEAFEVGQSVALLDEGRIVQCGPPEEIYWQPATIGAARLSGEVNVMRMQGDGIEKVFVSGALDGMDQPKARDLVFRPEGARLMKVSPGTGHRISRAVFSGGGYYYILDRLESPVRIFDAERLSLEDDYRISFKVKPWLNSDEGLLFS